MRRRARIDPPLGGDDDIGADEQNSRQFISALGRGLDVLRCFRRGEPPLTNQEIARRTGFPRPTISRILYTLRDLGHLQYYPTTRSYHLSGSAFVLGQIADANFDAMGAVRPIMMRYAKATGTNIGLSTRERLNMLYVEACEGASLIGLQLRVGDTMPIDRTAIGLAYLATVDESERASIVGQLRREGRGDVAELTGFIASAQSELSSLGFCLSTGRWRPEIHGVTLPVNASKLQGLYILSSGGPAELLPEKRLREEIGPQLRRAAKELQEALGTPSLRPRNR